MIRKHLLPVVIAALSAISGLPVAESQEIRLEPPQLDDQGMVRRVRPNSLPGRARRAIMARTQSPRMGVARVARQEPIQLARPRGIYGLAAAQQNGAGPQNNTAQNNTAQNNTVIQEPFIQDNVIIDDGTYFDDGAIVDGFPGQAYPSFQLISFADMEYSIGVQGVKGVPNLGGGGSFGFNQGINWGFPMPVLPLLGLSGQIGAHFTQSDFYGSNIGRVGTTNGRNQTFISAGLSRRVDYGFQMGVVFDYLNDNWYYEGSFAQIRADLAWVGEFGNQIGFRHASGLQDSTPQVLAGLAAVGFTGLNDIQPIDTYTFYYRQQWDQLRGGHVEAIGGFSENGDGMFGGDLLIPIAERWALTSEVTCLLPSTSDPVDESWNVALGLTWYPKGLSTWSQLYHRPLMKTANNGSFMFKPQ